MTDVGGLTSTTVEVELNGAWVAITSYVRLSGGSITRTVGRGSEVDDSQPGSLTLTLDNTDGRFYPDSPTIRSSPGVTAPNTYYPYFKEDARIRWYTNDGTPRLRFLGWITSIDPTFGTTPADSVVVVTATDSLGRMGRGELLGYVAQQILLDAPTAYYPLDEPTGTALFADASGQQGSGSLVVRPAGGITPGDFTGVTVEGFPSLFVTGTALTSESSRIQFPTAVALPATSWTIEFCVNIRATASSGGELYHQLATDTAGNTYGLTVNYISAASGTLTFKAFIGMTPPPGIATELVVISSSGYAATGLYHIAVTLSADGKTGYIWVNGAWATTTIGAAVTWLTGGVPMLKAGNASLTGHNIGNLAYYNAVLSGGRIGTHSSGATSTGAVYAGSANLTTVAAMATDVASFAGFTPTLESGFGPQNTTSVPTTGRTPLDVLQTVIRGEGGLVYDNGAGLYCRARSALNSSTVGATFDVEGDLQGSPSLSRSTINKVAYATASSVSQSVTVSDAAAITAVGKSATANLETSLSDVDDLYSIASHRIEQGVFRKTRVSRVVVDLFTAKNNLYSAVLTLQPGDRVRLSNLPSEFMGLTYVDGYVLGWTEELSWDSEVGYRFTFDLVPADAPAELGFDTYRFAAGDGNGTTGVLTASGTTVIITTTGLPWSAAAGDYPADLDINGERVTLTSAPGGAVSPQTFTGVTRGVAPTIARAHTAGEPVEVWDAIRFAF